MKTKAKKVIQTPSGKTITVDSVRKAVDVLDGIGCCLNGACIMNNEMMHYSFSTLAYNAVIGFPSYERSIDTPEDPVALREFLYEVFDPFLYKKDYTLRSVIDVREFTQKEIRKYEPHNNVSKRMFQLTMLMYLKNKFTEDARQELRKQSDSAWDIHGTEYVLD